jgi:hypothetical protein
VRLRKRDIKDVHLTDTDLKRLRKGYVVYKNVNKQAICLSVNTHDRKARRKIAKLEKELRLLKKERRNKHERTEEV